MIFLIIIIIILNIITIIIIIMIIIMSMLELTPWSERWTRLTVVPLGWDHSARESSEDIHHLDFKYFQRLRTRDENFEIKTFLLRFIPDPFRVFLLDDTLGAY